MKTAATLIVLGLGLVTTNCKREERHFREPSPSSEMSQSITMSGIHPGEPGSPSESSVTAGTPYSESAYAVSEGQRLFNAYNCVGCHFHGGGGIGPPLMDQQWIYGSEPRNIFATIVEGRPNGMPSFRGKIPDFQVWEIVAYVRSLSGQLPKDIAPGRDDHMNNSRPPTNTSSTKFQGPSEPPRSQ